MWLSRCRKAQDNLLRFWPSAGWGGLRSGFAGSACRTAREIYADASVRLVLICQHDASAGQTIFPSLPGSRPLRRSRSPPGSTRPHATGLHYLHLRLYRTPKGVVISHRGALNTCCDIIPAIRLARMTGCWPSPPYILFIGLRHFWRTARGRRAGDGVENQRRDPHAWCELIQRHQVRSGTASRRCSICC